MDKQELISKLKEFKKSIQEFHHKRWDYTINIPINIVENEIKNNSNYQNHDLEENIKLKNAIYHVERDKISRERKKEVYNIDKGNLKQQYGRLSYYIQLFSTQPAIDKFPCYDGYFLNDGYQGEEKNFSSVISDIDIMIGKIEILSEKDFQKIIKGSVNNWWKELNPVWWIFMFGKMIWRYKWISSLIILIGGYLITKSIDPVADAITKPVQNYLSGTIQHYFNK